MNASRPPCGPVVDARLEAPAAARNRGPILPVLRQVLPAAGLVLEIASGTGEHAAFFAAELPHLTWQPSERDGRLRASIAGYAEALGLPNLRPPLALDATRAAWPVARADALVCVNMLHIAPWQAAEGLFAGAGRLLAPGAPLFLYGPYRRAGRPTAPSNEAFDRQLRAQDPAWGLREVEQVEALAAGSGLMLDRVEGMPANNLSLVFRKQAER